MSAGIVKRGVVNCGNIVSPLKQGVVSELGIRGSNKWAKYVLYCQSIIHCVLL